MILTILLPIGIVLILASLYKIAAWNNRRNLKATQKYREHIRGHLLVADLVKQLFPPATDQVLTQPTIQTPTAQQVDPEHQEAKDKMVADIRRYFNQRKIDAAIADTPVRSHEELTYPTPPSIQRILE